MSLTENYESSAIWVHMSLTENHESSPPWAQELISGNFTSVLSPLIIQAAATTGTVIPRHMAIHLYGSTEPISSSMEGYINIESIMFEPTSVGGPQPASKASIESLPRIQVLDPGQECPICLAEYEINCELNQMPCRHVFHSDCLGKWLGIHGCCPVCRFSMPVDEEEKKEGEMDELIVHVIVSGEAESGRAVDMESESGNDDDDGGEIQSQAQYMEEID